MVDGAIGPCRQKSQVEVDNADYRVPCNSDVLDKILEFHKKRFSAEHQFFFLKKSSSVKKIVTPRRTECLIVL